MIPGDTLLPISANLIGGSGALQIPHHVDPAAANPNPNHLMRLDHHDQQQQQQLLPPPPAPPKKKRNLPGTPDPDAEVVSLSPTTLMATNRFLCEICGKGFQRDQNLQLHRRGHNLPWKLRQRPSVKDGAPPPRKKVYVCPEKTCVHHDPSRALGDLTGIKKHFSRKHGEKKWKCDKCSKKYAVQSDWKAHTKTCGTREYKCDCGTIFSRKDSFITHRAFCDALMEETTKFSGAATASSNAAASFVAGNNPPLLSGYGHGHPNLLNPHDMAQMTIPDGRTQKTDDLSLAWLDHQAAATNALLSNSLDMPPGSAFLQPPDGAASVCLPSAADMLQAAGDSSGFAPLSIYGTSDTSPLASAHMSATALLQKAAQMGATMSSPPATAFAGFGGLMLPRPKTTMLPQQPSSGRNEMEAAAMAMNKAHAAGGVVSDLTERVTSKTATPAVAQPAALESKYSNLMWGNIHSDQLQVGGGGDLTRDFLGLSGGGRGLGDQHHNHHQLGHAGRPFSAEELARLASMGSGMDAINSAAYCSRR